MPATVPRCFPNAPNVGGGHVESPGLLGQPWRGMEFLGRSGSILRRLMCAVMAALVPTVAACRSTTGGVRNDVEARDGSFDGDLDEPLDGAPSQDAVMQSEVRDVPDARDVPGRWPERGPDRSLRPLWPPTNAHVGSRRPLLRWSRPEMSASIQVTLCRDRALTVDCVRFESTTGEGRPPTDLAPGRWYWRPSSAGVDGPTWAVRVPTATIHDRAWGGDFDADGDGRADVLGVFAGGLAWWASGSDGPVGEPHVLDARLPSGRSPRLSRVGDLNGDGFSDAAVFPWFDDSPDHFPQLAVYLGSARGLDASQRALIPMRVDYEAAVHDVGDVDADGFVDLALESYFTFQVFRGGSDGLTPYVTVNTEGRYRPSLLRADVTGDGIPDESWWDGVSVSHSLAIEFSRAPGDAARLHEVRSAVTIPQLREIGDFDGDGVGDGIRLSSLGNEIEVLLGAPPVPRLSNVLGTIPCGHPVLGQAGDLDGDGRDELIGATSCIAWWPTPTVAGSAPEMFLRGFGTAPIAAMGIAGDLDGDGRDDLLSQPLPFYVYREDGPSNLLSWATLSDASGPSLREPGIDLDPDRRSPPVRSSAAYRFVGDIDGDGGSELLGAAAGSCAWIVRSGAAPTSRFAATPFCDAPGPFMPVGVGDVDGDGFGDMVARTARGGVVLCRNGLSPDLRCDPWLTVADGDASEYAIFPAGDLNGDRLADLVRHTAASNTVFLGARGSLPREGMTFVAPVSGPVIRMGPAGDLDRDGMGDLLVVVAPSAGGDPTGAAVLPGTATGVGAAPLFSAVSDVVPVGDVDGDGFDDVVLPVRGAIRFYRGGTAGPREVAAASLTLRSAYGLMVPSALGDVDGDGRADIGIQTDYFAAGAQISESSIVRGSPTGPDYGHPLRWPTDVSRSTAGEPPPFLSGGPSRGAGDWDGDHVSDVLVGRGPIAVRSIARPRGRPPIVLGGP